MYMGIALHELLVLALLGTAFLWPKWKEVWTDDWIAPSGASSSAFHATPESRTPVRVIPKATTVLVTRDSESEWQVVPYNYNQNQAQASPRQHGSPDSFWVDLVSCLFAGVASWSFATSIGLLAATCCCRRYLFKKQDLTAGATIVGTILTLKVLNKVLQASINYLIHPFFNEFVPVNVYEVLLMVAMAMSFLWPKWVALWTDFHRATDEQVKENSSGDREQHMKECKKTADTNTGTKYAPVERETGEEEEGWALVATSKESNMRLSTVQVTAVHRPEVPERAAQFRGLQCLVVFVLGKIWNVPTFLLLMILRVCAKKDLNERQRLIARFTILSIPTWTCLLVTSRLAKHLNQVIDDHYSLAFHSYELLTEHPQWCFLFEAEARFLLSFTFEFIRTALICAHLFVTVTLLYRISWTYIHGHHPFDTPRLDPTTVKLCLCWILLSSCLILSQYRVYYNPYMALEIPIKSLPIQHKDIKRALRRVAFRYHTD